MKYVSLFSGIEAATVAWKPLGWQALAYAEIDPFPKAVLAHHYPDVPDLGDMTKVDWRKYRGTADIVVGGSPCFPAGTLVLTSERLKPIEEVKAGDMVLTHRNRWRRVLSVGSKQSDTIILRGQGVNSLECTANHPFLSDEKHPVWDTASRSYKRHLTGEPTWVQASARPSTSWATGMRPQMTGIASSSTMITRTMTESATKPTPASTSNIPRRTPLASGTG